MQQNKQMDDFFHHFIREQITPCLTTAVANSSATYYRFIGGSALSHGNGITITEQTSFNIGSVTKVITGTLLMKLLERGEVSLNDPVKRFISGFHHEQITLFHLLTHTGGFVDYPWIAWPKRGERASYLAEIYRMNPTAPVGEQASYFTFGYSILMDLIEKISGSTIEQFAQTELFQPLGMAHTSFERSSPVIKEYVLPCTHENDRFDPNLDDLDPSGDSGLYSNVNDLLKFGRMILQYGSLDGRRILSEATVRTMLREATGGIYGKTPVFWMKTDFDPYGCFGDLNSPHAVGHPGFSGCMLFIDPVQNATGAIVTNSKLLHEDWRHYRTMINVLLSCEQGGCNL